MLTEEIFFPPLHDICKILKKNIETLFIENYACFFFTILYLCYLY